MNGYYTLKDQRDRSFELYGTVKEILEYLGDIKGCHDIYDVDEQLKRENNGDAGYYIYELNRDM